MTETVDNLMLEDLKRFQATLDRIEPRQGGLTGRIANLEGGLASPMQHLAQLATADAAQQIAVDDVDRRLDRIERRLELTS